jgi:type I restriction-modification system DNA methylase subunit
MSDAMRQIALPLETHRNHFLFSDYYLNEVLPRQPVWRHAEAGAQEALAAIAALYEQRADALPHYNEPQTEAHWIQPVLDVLGHTYEVQPVLAGAPGTPDYAFFADEAARQATAPALGKAEYWESVLAVGDAKRWDRPLDKRIVDGAPDAFTNANPCYQIDYYLRQTGCAWGMVSNGRQWRLYHRDTSFRLDVFYEVDLVQLIEQGNLAAWRYFYLFFRAEAFRPDGEGRCWLDEVLAQSTAYAVHVGGELKERVYEALRLLAQGFLDYPTSPTNQVFSEEPGLCLLPHVHEACLILLYRLLFLLYAESRGLLPLDNPGYAGQYSLKAIKEDVAHKLDAGVVYLAEKATIWDDLRTLFGIIYNGQAALGVPAYDGRLFDPAHYPFLEAHSVGDRYLAQAIDLLARAEAGPGQGLSFVDYRDLAIRHLGSIYEGLLEYRLAYAAEEMAVVRRDKGEEIVPLSEAEKPGFSEKTRFLGGRIPVGQVYLVTDRGERKATGSYYTPDYIVKYIVERTLGPLADAQAQAVESEIAALKAKNRGRARQTQAYKDELARLQNSFADCILALNCLDPAMGSGHFLVEATDYLARRIVEAGVVTEGLTGGSTALTGAGDEESELGYWRRRVVERCIYGVDLNPLAVELARLSLWLMTVAKGKPLSFLDHHLRCGNSLIGARVADLQVLPVGKKQRRKTRKTSEVSETAEVAQLAMWDEGAFTQDMYRVVGAMRRIGEYETADLVSVREKERLFDETVERERRKWRAIADLWTATYFGLELTPELYNACVQYAQGKPVLLQAAQAEAVLAQAHEIWQQRRFFHWEIEFPEVFFDEYGRHKGDAAGFDAVVGNPPYGFIADRAIQTALSNTYRAVSSFDLYIVFLERGIQLLKRYGTLGYIAPTSWQTGIAHRDFRQHSLQTCQIAQIVNLPYDVFPDAYIDTSVYVLKKEKIPEEVPVPLDRPVQVYEFDKRDKAAPKLLAGLVYDLLNSGDWLDDPQLRFVTDKGLLRLRKALTKITKISLGEIMDSARGILASEADLNTAPHGPEWKPYFDGDVYRYQLNWEPKTWVKYGPDLHEMPGGYRYFVGSRILVRRLISRQARLMATQVSEEFVNKKDLYNVLITGEDYSSLFVLALLNSRLFSYLYITQSTVASRDDFPQVTLADLRKLPIRRISFNTSSQERERLAGVGIAEATEWIESAERGSADSVSFSAFSASAFGRWLDACLSAVPEQSDVVHDLLAHRAGRMIELHKGKQAEVKGFLDWLATYTGLPVADWALKTNLQHYYEQDWAGMQRVLRSNQRRLPNVDMDVDRYKNAPAARLRAAWETSLETLRPLLARIAATDRLIDLIVYRLYELTEKEVTVVEGKG